MKLVRKFNTFCKLIHTSSFVLLEQYWRYYKNYWRYQKLYGGEQQTFTMTQWFHVWKCEKRVGCTNKQREGDQFKFIGMFHVFHSCLGCVLLLLFSCIIYSSHEVTTTTTTMTTTTTAMTEAKSSISIWHSKLFGIVPSWFYCPCLSPTYEIRNATATTYVLTGRIHPSLLSCLWFLFSIFTSSNSTPFSFSLHLLLSLSISIHFYLRCVWPQANECVPHSFNPWV